MITWEPWPGCVIMSSFIKGLKCTYLLILKLTGRSTANKDIFKDGQKHGSSYSNMKYEYSSLSA